MSQTKPIAVIGLGYVGLPLAVELGKHRQVIGYDIDEKRISELAGQHDRTREVHSEELAGALHLQLTSNRADLDEARIFIVTVPTPIDGHKRPNLAPLISASEMVGASLKVGDIVIYESTVYPGATEEECIPVLERVSGLKYNEDFYCGYSPERINPGDKEHRLPTIRKVTSGSTPEVADEIDALYSEIITAGTFKAESIRVAEAAKVIENTQRDLNIALVNELALIFGRLGIDTEAVLEAAGTKWNFLPFRPGLVGGHCIGVDPYYLTYKAESIGYNPQVILAGRRINDTMPTYVAGELVKAMLKRRLHVQDSRILVLGFAFKENCPDVRNTKVVDMVRELEEFGSEVDIFDPWVDPREAKHEYGVSLTEEIAEGVQYDAVILAVPHDDLVRHGPESIRKLLRPEGVFYDLKSVFPKVHSDLRL